MKTENNNLFGKGVRDLCDRARSWCGKLDALFSTTGDTEPSIDLRGQALSLVNIIRQLIARLLDEERLHRESLAALSFARHRKNSAAAELFRKLRVFRQLGLANESGPMVPVGALPFRAEELATLATTVSPLLDSPDLKVPQGVNILPTLRPGLDRAITTLTAATTELEPALARSRETRNTRAATMDDLRAHLTAARSLYRALCDLRSLEHGKEAPCATR